MTQIKKEQETLTSIVLEKIDVLRQRLREVAPLIEQVSIDINELTTRATDPMEKEKFTQLLRDFENSIKVEHNQLMTQLDSAADRFGSEEKISLKSLLEMPWEKMEKTMKRVKHVSNSAKN